MECVFARVIATRGELVAGGRGEFKGGTGGRCEGVCDGVEGEGTGKGECGDDVGRSNKSMSGWVGVVTACEVAVVRSDDWKERKKR